VPLDQGLRRLLDALPEQLSEEGTGALHHNRYWADIEGATVDAATLFGQFCGRFQEVTPDVMDLEVEPGTPTAVLDCGETVTMALPMRGTVQVRVAELGPTSLTLQTVEGHPLAGAVCFTLNAPDARRRSPWTRPLAPSTGFASRSRSSTGRPRPSITWP
jgi:NADH dehydrogenase